jgi:hypothetical protein
MTNLIRLVVSSAIMGIVALALPASPLFAQTPEAPSSPGTPMTPPQAPMTHEQMHQMMDAMHGAGASERMHQAMGEGAEQMMDQCTTMMNMMQMMPGMMNQTEPGTTPGPGTP